VGCVRGHRGRRSRGRAGRSSAGSAKPWAARNGFVRARGAGGTASVPRPSCTRSDLLSCLIGPAPPPRWSPSHGRDPSFCLSADHPLADISRRLGTSDHLIPGQLAANHVTGAPFPSGRSSGWRGLWVSGVPLNRRTTQPLNALVVNAYPRSTGDGSGPQETRKSLGELPLIPQAL